MFAFEPGHGPDANELGGLGWDRLNETLVCLAAHDALPPTISREDREAVHAFTFMRSLAPLGDGPLCRVAMGKFVTDVLEPLRECARTGRYNAVSGGSFLRIVFKYI